MRKTVFINGEYYHIFNRGVDKRQIFLDQYDIDRFFKSMREFNVLEPIGSIYENSFKNPLGGSTSKLGVLDGGNELVEFVAYCLNPNHYHFVLKQSCDRGIEKFMQRLGTGYTMFFNEKYDRSGALFQGKFKAVHIDSNEQLLYTSAYVNLNDRVHQLGGSTSKSSWGEYVGIDGIDNINKRGDEKNFCTTDIILDQFEDRNGYIDFAEEALLVIKENRGKEELLEE